MSRERAELTIKFLEDALDGARAATTGHGDVELVVMLRHVGDAFGRGASAGWKWRSWRCEMEFGGKEEKMYGRCGDAAGVGGVRHLCAVL